MSGGHWQLHGFMNSRTPLPVLRRNFGSPAVFSFLKKVRSSPGDYMNITKPNSGKEPGKPHPSDNIVRTVAISSGGGKIEQPKEELNEDSNSSIESLNKEEIEVGIFIPEEAGTVKASIVSENREHKEQKKQKRKITEPNSKKVTVKKFKFKTVD